MSKILADTPTKTPDMKIEKIKNGWTLNNTYFPGKGGKYVCETWAARSPREIVMLIEQWLGIYDDPNIHG